MIFAPFMSPCTILEVHQQCTKDSSGVVGVSDPYHLGFWKETKKHMNNIEQPYSNIHMLHSPRLRLIVQDLIDEEEYALIKNLKEYGSWLAKLKSLHPCFVQGSLNHIKSLIKITHFRRIKLCSFEGWNHGFPLLLCLVALFGLVIHHDPCCPSRTPELNIHEETKQQYRDAFELHSRVKMDVDTWGQKWRNWTKKMQWYRKTSWNQLSMTGPNNMFERQSRGAQKSAELLVMQWCTT